MASIKARCRWGPSGSPAGLPLFLDVDDGFGAGQAQREAGIVLLKTGVVGGQRVRFGGPSGLACQPVGKLRPSFGWVQAADGPGIPGPAPVGEVGGVEALAAQDRGDATGLGGVVGLGEDTQLVLRGEGPAARASCQFGRRSQRCRHNRRPTASVCAGTAGCVSLGVEHGHVRGDPSAPSSVNSRGVGVSASLARRGPPSMTCLLAASKSWMPTFVGMTGVVAPPKSRSFGRLVVRRETGKE